MSGIVYVLTNAAMPGLVKIGVTNDVASRMAQLHSAGVPLPFDCFFAAEVEDAEQVEQKLHRLFSSYRLNPSREFFEVEPEKVVLALSLGEYREVTPEPRVEPAERDAVGRVRIREQKLDPAPLGIKPGDVLTFSRDASVTTVVAADGHAVQLDGEDMSLSAAALRVLHGLGYKSTAVNGYQYWAFDGELLAERRRRLEQQYFGEHDQ